jgi:hypothetical protein
MERYKNIKEKRMPEAYIDFKKNLNLFNTRLSNYDKELIELQNNKSIENNINYIIG